jgi:hypothetical protein
VFDPVPLLVDPAASGDLIRSTDGYCARERARCKEFL